MGEPARKPLPTMGQMIPEFQFILCLDRDARDKDYVLLRHVGSGKVYDSRNCPEIPTDPKACQEFIRALWWMWTDQGKPETGFYLDASDGPNYKPLLTETLRTCFSKDFKL